MRKLLALGAVVVLMNAGTAYASTISPSTVTLDGTYSVTYEPITGNKPTFKYDLGKSFKEKLTPGESTAELNFFTASPAGSSGLGCGGRKEAKCNSSNDTVSGTIFVTFSFEELGGPKGKTVIATGSLTETGIYEADYAGQLSCSSSTGNQTDCIDWQIADSAIPVKLSNGNILDVTLFDAEDWAITPKISFDLDPTPLPASLPLFVGGLECLGLIGRRTKRRTLLLLLLRSDQRVLWDFGHIVVRRRGSGHRPNAV